MNPNPKPVRFAAHVHDERDLQDQLHAWLLRAVEAEGNAAAVARALGLSRNGLLLLRKREIQFGLGTAFRLARAYPDA